MARLGEDLAQGERPDWKGIPEGLQTYAQVYASQVQNEIDRLARSPLRGDALIKQIQQVDPYRGRLIQAMIDGRYPEPTGFSARSPFWQGMLNLANKIDPTLDANTFHVRSTIFRDFTAGMDGRNVTAIGTAYRHLKELESRANAKASTR